MKKGTIKRVKKQENINGKRVKKQGNGSHKNKRVKKQENGKGNHKK